MDDELARLAMICLAVVAGLVVVGATAVSCLVAWKQPSESTQAFLGIIGGANSIRLLTALGVVFAAVFLALSGALTEGVIALLSSVAGFVLGGVKRPEPKDDKDAT